MPEKSEIIARESEYKAGEIGELVFNYSVYVRDLQGNPVHPAAVHLEPRQSGLDAHDGNTGGANGLAVIAVNYSGYYDIEASGNGLEGIDQRKNVNNGGSHTIYID